MSRCFRPRPVALACAIVTQTWSLGALAQNAPAPTAPPRPPAAAASAPAPAVQVIEVPGIRLSLERSLATKKSSEALVEVISAEDVGKMPDKNLADSLQRLATVAVRTDYDEAEKVSMRGTNPDMTLIVFNGHTVSGGDWYIADQQASSRSTSLSLMPSSVLNQALVYRTSQANVVDGGLAGTINVTTRKPLSAKQKLGGFASFGSSYATLPGRSAPDLSASVNWKNDSNTFGLIGQVFAEKRFVRRDTLSRNGFNFGWNTIDIAGISSSATPMRGITDASLAGTGLKAADLNGVRMPSAMGGEYIEGVRDRKGGMVSLQWRPHERVDLTLTSFQSKMNANNYGRLNGSAMEAMLRGQSFHASAAEPAGTTVPNPRVYAEIRNPVIATGTTYWGDTLKYLKSAEIVFPDGTRPALVGLNDNSYRDGASSTSGFTDLEGSFQVNDRLVVKSLISTTEGRGETLEDQGVGWYRFGRGVSYTLNGLGSAPQFASIGAGENKPGINADGTGYQAYTQRNSRSRTIDKEWALALNAEYDVNVNGLTLLDVGLRHADHKRNFQRWVYTRKRAAYDPLPSTGYSPFPANFASGIGGGFENAGFYYDQNVLQQWIDNQWRSYGDDWDRLMSSAIDMRELQQAFYAMQSFDLGKLSGNFGLRVVRTQVMSNIVNRLPASVGCVKSNPTLPTVPCAQFPRAIVDAADLYNFWDGDTFGRPLGQAPGASYNQPYYFEPTERSFTDRLPSLNLRYEVQRDMFLRAGLSRTMGRQNYNVWAQGVTSPTCNANTGICTVVGPNPNLKPLSSENLDLNWSWYFAPRSAVSVGFFKSEIDGYTKFGGLVQGSSIELLDPVTNQIRTYFVISAGQQKARLEGVDIGYEQPIGRTGFGVTANVSRAKTRVEDGRPMTGASEWAGNVGLYYEDSKLSARLVVNYRGEYVASATAPAPNSNAQANTVIQGVTLPSTALTWAAPVTNVAFSAGYRFTPNIELLFSATNLTDPVRGTYRHGEYEEQKQDVSGRQYYLNLKLRY
jgi:iron complex outermembrane recepter protein